MATHHEGHTHKHGPDCGHVGIVHDGQPHRADRRHDGRSADAEEGQPGQDGVEVGVEREQEEPGGGARGGGRCGRRNLSRAVHRHGSFGK